MHYSVPNLDKRNFHWSHLELLRENYFVGDTTNDITEKVIFTEQEVETSKTLYQDKTNRNLGIVSLEI